jgi:hypothetical protein
MAFAYHTKPRGIDVVKVQPFSLLFFQLGIEHCFDLLRDMRRCLLMRQRPRVRSLDSVKGVGFPTGIAKNDIADIAVMALMAALLTEVADLTGRIDGNYAPRS